MLVGLGLAEVSAAIWLGWTHRVPDLPTSVPQEAGSPRLPTRLDTPKDGSVLIVVVGESSAEGVPYRKYLSVGEIVAWQLRKAIPGRTFRVENQARSGTRLEHMHQRLATLTHRPDAVIIYAGHNEFYARHGWTYEVSPYYLDAPIPSAPPFRKAAERVSPLIRMIDEAIDLELLAAAPPAGGATPDRRPLAHGPGACGAAGGLPRPAGADRLVLPADRGIADPGTAARQRCRIRAQPLDPAAGNPRAEREAFALAFQEARAREKTDPAGSIVAYRRLIERQPGFAESHFRLARLLEARGEYEEAYRRYIEARDLDGHPFRCLTSFQDVYRELASRYEAILVDGQAVFHARHPHGMLDDYLFNDGFHPSFEGHVALAEAILKALQARRAFGWPEAVPAPTIDLAECAAHFGVGAVAWRERLLRHGSVLQVCGPAPL